MWGRAKPKGKLLQPISISYLVRSNALDAVISCNWHLEAGTRLASWNQSKIQNGWTEARSTAVWKSVRKSRQMRIPKSVSRISTLRKFNFLPIDVNSRFLQRISRKLKWFRNTDAFNERLKTSQKCVSKNKTLTPVSSYIFTFLFVHFVNKTFHILSSLTTRVNLEPTLREE